MSDTIYKVVRKLVQEHSAEEAAELALHGLTKAELVEFVRPEVERLARSMIRANVRRNEAEAFPASDLSPVSDSGSREPEGRPAAIKQLMGEGFLLPDGVYVLWGEATPEQHEARAGWLHGQAAALVETARRHERAALLIRDAGVVCLNDLGLAAAEVAA